MGDHFFPARNRPLMMAMLEKFNEDMDPKDVGISFLQQCIHVSGGDNVKAELHKRYSKCSPAIGLVPFAPDHPTIIDHIINPLLEAMKCYILNLPVACIALSGLVGEMVAIWRFQMLKPTRDDRVLDERLQKLLFGQSFDKLGQERRIEVLFAYGDIDKEIKGKFNELRSIRRKYLHFMESAAIENADKDALKTFKLACLLVNKAFNITKDENGDVILPPRLHEFLVDILKPIRKEDK
ncbi:MAG: hypothetical protein ACNS63_11395 [Candidatus Nitrospinota bacterium M3_3B_026]